MMDVRWLPAAFEDLQRLHGFIRSENPAAALQALVRIKEAVEILQKNPNIGRRIDAPHCREMIIPFGAAGYVLRYRQETSALFIIRVWHSREFRH